MVIRPRPSRGANAQYRRVGSKTISRAAETGIYMLFQQACPPDRNNPKGG